MASVYLRTTASADLAELAPTVTAALNAYADEHGLHLSEELPAWSTRSINPPASSLLGRLLRRRANPTDPDSEHQTLLIVHPTHLIVEISGAERGVDVTSVPWASATMIDGPEDPADGFTITGFADRDGGSRSVHIGIGSPLGTACRDAVRAAVDAAHRG